MKNKVLVVLALILFSNLVFAETPELINLIDKYFDATQKKDAQTIVNIFYYPEGTADWFIDKEKENTQYRINLEQLQEIKYDFIKEEIFNQGKNAYIEIFVTEGTVIFSDTGEKSDIKGTRFFIFEKQNNQWKILNPTTDFDSLQKEDYVKSFKESFFASIEEQNGFDPNPPGNSNSDQNGLIGIFDSLIGLISIGVVIVFILIIVFSLTGNKKEKNSEQKVIVNVQAPAQTEPKPMQKPTEQPKPQRNRILFQKQSGL